MTGKKVISKYLKKLSPLMGVILLILVLINSFGINNKVETETSNISEIRTETAKEEVFSDNNTSAKDSAVKVTRNLPPKESSFEIHFLDVGQADSALVLCDGHAMLIDGGNKGDSSLIYGYLKKMNIRDLDYIVCTHPHEDHVGGLSGALNFAEVEYALCPVKKYDSKGFENFAKYLEKQGTPITVPEPGDRFQFGSAEFTVLGPLSAATGNNNSIVLRIVYGETSFLFMGDAEYAEEQEILDAGFVQKSNVLKIGHHGSDSSTSYRLLYEAMPEYAVISVGANNSYGHPEENTLSRLRDADVTVYRTDQNGNIICKSDGKNLSFSLEKDVRKGNTFPSSEINRSERNFGSLNKQTGKAASNNVLLQTKETIKILSENYVLNINSKKFHRPDCASAKKIKNSNKEYYSGTRDDLIGEGYEPCKKCNP